MKIENIVFTIFPVVELKLQVADYAVETIRFLGFSEVMKDTDLVLKKLNPNIKEGCLVVRSAQDLAIVGIQNAQGECRALENYSIMQNQIINYFAYFATQEFSPVAIDLFRLAQRYNMVDEFFEMADIMSQVGVELTTCKDFDSENSYGIPEKKLTELMEERGSEDVWLFYQLALKEVFTSEEPILKVTGYFIDVGIQTVFALKEK